VLERGPVTPLGTLAVLASVDAGADLEWDAPGTVVTVQLVHRSTWFAGRFVIELREFAASRRRSRGRRAQALSL